MDALLMKLSEYGLVGVVIGIGSLLVLKPMVTSWRDSLAMSLKEIAAQREERLSMCAVHREHDDKTLQLLQGLMMSMESLVRRANGGGH